MITKHVIENLEKELITRDDKISSLTRKNKELKKFQSDWIDSQISDKEFPKDYIKQVKELAEIKIMYEEQLNKYIEDIKKLDDKFKKEVDRLKSEIEFLNKQLPKPNFFNILGGNKK